jgi:hypothetical protein
MMVSYTITDGQLVALHHGRPEGAWVLPDPDGVAVLTVELEDLTGCGYVDIVQLSDGRHAVIDNRSATLYRSAADSFSDHNPWPLEKS